MSQFATEDESLFADESELSEGTKPDHDGFEVKQDEED